MELIERDGFLELLQTGFVNVAEGEGHCVFVISKNENGNAELGNQKYSPWFAKIYVHEAVRQEFIT